jgi:uncharacterized phage protein (TIGR01671 family)
MNKEIKFRGMCIISGNWVYGDLIHGVGHKDGKLYILPLVKNLASVKHCDPLDGVEVDPKTIGQFTGLHDKSGKEIYEGDILNVCNGSINGRLWMQKPYSVKYILNKGFDICMFCWDKDGNNIMDSTHWCEVIGNIYEHPELLKP